MLEPVMSISPNLPSLSLYYATQGEIAFGAKWVTCFPNLLADSEYHALR